MWWRSAYRSRRTREARRGTTTRAGFVVTMVRTPEGGSDDEHEHGDGRGRGPSRPGHEGVRRGRRAGARARRSHAPDPERALHRDHGPVGLREVDAVALHGGPRRGDERPGDDRRSGPRRARRSPAHHAAARAHRVRVPGVQPRPDALRGREHRAAVHARRPVGRPAVARRGRRRGRHAGPARVTARRSCRVASSSASRWRVPW